MLFNSKRFFLWVGYKYNFNSKVCINNQFTYYIVCNHNQYDHMIYGDNWCSDKLKIVKKLKVTHTLLRILNYMINE